MKFRVIIFLFFLAIFVVLLLSFIQLGGKVSLQLLTYQVDFPLYVAILFLVVTFLICFGIIKQYYSYKFSCLRLIEKVKLRKSQSIHKKLELIVEYFQSNSKHPNQKQLQIKKLRNISNNQNYQTLLSIEELFLSKKDSKDKNKKFAKLINKLSTSQQIKSDLTLNFCDITNTETTTINDYLSIIEYIKMNVYFRLSSNKQPSFEYDLYVFNNLFSKVFNSNETNLTTKILFNSNKNTDFTEICHKYKKVCDDKTLLKWCVLLETLNYQYSGNTQKADKLIRKNKEILKDSKLACKIFLTLQKPKNLQELEKAVLTLIKLFDKSAEANFYYLIYNLQTDKEQLAAPLMDNYLKLLSKSSINSKKNKDNLKMGFRLSLIKTQNQNQQILYLIEQLAGCSASFQEKYLRQLVAITSKNNLLNISLKANKID